MKRVAATGEACKGNRTISGWISPRTCFKFTGIRDAAEKVVVRKRLRRRQVLEFFKSLPPCLIGMEACATAHYWARELTKLGHRVRLSSKAG